MPKSIMQKVREKINEKEFPVNTFGSITVEGNPVDEEQLINHIKDLRIGDYFKFSLCAYISSPIMNQKKFHVNVRKDEEGYNVDVEKHLD